MHIIWREYTRINNEVESPAYQAHLSAALDRWEEVKTDIGVFRDRRKTIMPEREEVVRRDWTLLKVGRELERWRRVRVVWRKRVLTGQRMISRWAVRTSQGAPGVGANNARPSGQSGADGAESEAATAEAAHVGSQPGSADQDGQPRPERGGERNLPSGQPARTVGGQRVAPRKRWRQPTLASSWMARPPNRKPRIGVGADGLTGTRAAGVSGGGGTGEGLGGEEQSGSDVATAVAEDGAVSSHHCAAITRLQKAIRGRHDRRRRSIEDRQALDESERRARAKVISSKTCSRMRHRAQYRGATALVDHDDPTGEPGDIRRETVRRRGGGSPGGSSASEAGDSDGRECEPG